MLALIVREFGLDAATICRLGLSSAQLWHTIEGTGGWISHDSTDPFHFLWPYGGFRKLSNIGVVTLPSTSQTEDRPYLHDGMTVCRLDSQLAGSGSSRQLTSIQQVSSVANGYANNFVVEMWLSHRAAGKGTRQCSLCE